MASKKQYRVKLSRSILSTACVTVEAGSRNEALFLAGKVEIDEEQWEDDVSAPQIDGVEIVGE